MCVSCCRGIINGTVHSWNRLTLLIYDSKYLFFLIFNISHYHTNVCVS